MEATRVEGAFKGPPGDRRLFCNICNMYLTAEHLTGGKHAESVEKFDRMGLRGW